MKTISVARMREAERYAIQVLGIPGLLLMEHAARAVVDEMEGMLGGDCAGKYALFFCGGGNNGGDGFASARQFLARGGKASVVTIGHPEKITGDAQMNLDMLLSLGQEVQFVSDATIGPVLDDLPPADILVDALLGIGADRALSGAYEAAVRYINGQTNILAVDIPTGVDAQTGKILGEAIKARKTVTFQHPKLGQFLYPGREHTGELSVHDICLPQGFEYTAPDGADILERSMLHSSDFFKKRPANVHKGNYGHLLIIAGSKGMAGAAALCANAALAMGVGLCTIACPLSIVPIVQALAPCAMAQPLPERDGALAPDAAGPLLKLVKDKDAIAIGPGIQVMHGPELVLEAVLELENMPLIVDADAINILARNKRMLPRLSGRGVITPHPAEMGRLMDRDTQEVVDNAYETATKFAAESNIVTLLKGSTTIIAQSVEETRVNASIGTHGTPGMATGGSGDVLCGVIAGLICMRGAVGMQEYYECTRIGYLVHALAGEIAAVRKGEIAMTAQDIVDALPETIHF